MRYDLNDVESAVKPQPTNQPYFMQGVQGQSRWCTIALLAYIFRIQIFIILFILFTQPFITSWLHLIYFLELIPVRAVLQKKDKLSYCKCTKIYLYVMWYIIQICCLHACGHINTHVNGHFDGNLGTFLIFDPHKLLSRRCISCECISEWLMSILVLTPLLLCIFF